MKFDGGLGSLALVTGTATFQGFSVVVYGNALLEDTSGFPLSLTPITGNVIIGANPLLCSPPEILTASFWSGVGSHCFKSNVLFDFFRLVVFQLPSQETARIARRKEERTHFHACLLMLSILFVMFVSSFSYKFK